MGSTNGDRGGEIPQPRDSFVNDEQDGDENFSALREAENLCLLGSIYNRLDKQFKLLQEQKLAQQFEAERAENHRMKVEQIFNDLGARMKQTEISVETIRGNGGYSKTSSYVRTTSGVVGLNTRKDGICSLGIG